MGFSSGRIISGIASIFLMNFGIWGFTIFFPARERSFLKASTSEREGEGGDIPPPGAAMAAAVELAVEDLAQPGAAISTSKRLYLCSLDLLVA